MLQGIVQSITKSQLCKISSTVIILYLLDFPHFISRFFFRYAVSFHGKTSLREANTKMLKPARGMVILNDFSLEIIAVKSVELIKGKESRLWPRLFGTTDLKTSQKKRIVAL